MTDLEITRLCAEAMGITHSWNDSVVYLGTGAWDLERCTRYNPMHDDAQAMALIKKFHLSLTIWDKIDGRDAAWWRIDSQPELDITVRHADLNRAICECVAKMHQARVG